MSSNTLQLEKRFELNFNKKLLHLINERRYSMERVVHILAEKIDLNIAEIKEKLNNDSKFPGKKITTELCLFFNVPINYFLPPYAVFFRDYRKKYDVSISKLSRILGISRQLLHQYENGEKLPSIKNFYIFSKFYDEPLEIIINYKINEMK
jgi:transcriptional regulator with XRE-family HTH domain